MYALPHQFPAVPLQSIGFLPVFLPSPVSSCSPSVIGVDARFIHQFPAVLLQSFGFLPVFFRGFQLLSFSHRHFHLKVLQSRGGCYQRSAIRFVDTLPHFLIRVYSWKCGVDGCYRQMWQVSFLW